jgi:predicted exporter
VKRSRHWLWLLLLIPIGIGLARLRFDVEVLNLLPEQSPVVRGLKLYQQHFADANQLVITVSARDSNLAETAARTLAQFLREKTTLISSASWQPPWLEHPGQSAELLAYLWLNQPPDVFGQLTNHVAPQNLNKVLSETRERLNTSLSAEEIARLSYDPFELSRLPEGPAKDLPQFGEGQELFASADGTFHLIFVQANKNLLSYKACVAWLDEIKRQVQECRNNRTLPDGVVIRYTGRPAFVAEIGGGMERDMAGPSLGTLAVIGVLFYLAHRTWRPLVWLIVLLIGILAGTLAFGGLFFRTLNVVSLGFASILIGLAEDFAIVLYQEARLHPASSIAAIRREAAPGIFWSALTTAGAFLILNLSSLPGLGELGSLVSIGIVLAALVMPFAYLAPLLKRSTTSTALVAHTTADHGPRATRGARRSMLYLTAFILAACGGLLWLHPPRFDRSPAALKPKNSEANAALDEIKYRMQSAREPLWLVVQGRTEREVAQQLRVVRTRLEQARSDGVIESFALPSMLYPQPERQAVNLPVAAWLAGQRGQLRAAVLTNGFTRESFTLTENILATWERAASQSGVFWPTNDNSRWVLEKFTARSTNGLLAVGFVYAPTNNPAHQVLRSTLDASDIFLTGWELLGTTITGLVTKELPRICLSVLALVVATLWLAFRNLRDVALSLATIAFSFVALSAVMSLAGWNWNMMNLTALPLLLGLGVDYSIHMQLALRRFAGNPAAAHHSIGRALLLAGATTVAGFAALAFSSNAGMASLGWVCGAGIGCALLTAVYLLPAWWTRLAPAPTKPSSFYRAELWRVGLLITHILPPRSCALVCRAIGAAYWFLCGHRRDVVIANLLPALDADRTTAKKTARRLFQNFAQKLTDLWRYEGGRSIDSLFGELTGWEHFAAAQSTKRGVLLLTPHLGNWEFGAPLLAARGVKLLVVTLVEPDAELTEIRQTARARRGIETLVIGDDTFAFVEIIRRLEAGATVALLVDRPPEASAIPVELFGKTFAASIAAAELARASGCVLLPVCLPRTDKGYAAHILPEIPYDRASLRAPEARQKLTQEIMRAFEPVIRQHLDQWYHFVPIWPE